MAPRTRTTEVQDKLKETVAIPKVFAKIDKRSKVIVRTGETKPNTTILIIVVKPKLLKPRDKLLPFEIQERKRKQFNKLAESSTFKFPRGVRPPERD